MWGHQSLLRLRQGWEGKVRRWPGHSPLHTCRNDASPQHRRLPERQSLRTLKELGAGGGVTFPALPWEPTGASSRLRGSSAVGPTSMFIDENYRDSLAPSSNL